ncbi:MAG: hypothetical protein HZB67_00865 [Candidatus Aenigmarchaeota archaeon]|nr:hypothetical protein [Candidatus Aenigmarchaeota archaeon]MBI5224679.1 hypothetical protein [Candidatus Micrarchaeota archaeon]
MRPRKPITIYDRKIAAFLLVLNSCITAHKLSERMNISWNTADAHLHKLYQLGVVKKCSVHRHTPKRVYWRINRP